MASTGAIAHYGVIENAHARHILDVSVAPARVPPQVERDALAIARATLEALDVVGVLCVELFLTRDGRVLVNELAPRTHNSGHLTIDACATSQFEQQLRAVCGLPLGATDLVRPAAMANLLGDLWQDGEPRWADALARARHPAPPLRQAPGQARAQDGPPHRAGGHAGRRRRARPRGPGRAHRQPCPSLTPGSGPGRGRRRRA